MNVMKLSHNDCGQRTRTNFELSESGENQQILDEIQYQIDCLKSANANSQSKRKALAALTKIFSVSINASMRRRFIGKVQDIFAVLSGLFAKTSSWTTEFFLSGMQLVIVLNADGDGSFDPTLVLPKRLLSAILCDHNPQCGNALCSCLSSAHGTAQETTGLFGETRSESIEVGHHRKRKFTKNSTRNDEDSKAKAPENSARLDMKKGGSTDDLLSTLAETFWCPTCAQKCATIAGGGSSGGGIVHHSSILQLVILNRTLTAKVATLASVHTEFFQTATNAINSEPSNDDGEVMHSPKKASLSDLALRSPDDPSSRSSKAFFQRQADALVQLQALMQDHAEDCGGDRQFSCYLDHLCKRLREDARSAMGMLAEQRQQQQQQQLAGGGAAQASKSSLSRQGTLFGRMWLMLGILDSACFRSPQIQRYLATLTIEEAEEAEKEDEENSPLPEDNTTAFPNHVSVVLVHLLQALTPAVARQMQDSRRHLQPAGDAHAPAPTPTTAAAATAASKLPPHWAKFHGLFPEVPVVLSHSSASVESGDGDNYWDLFSDEASASAPPTAKETANEVTARAAVGAMELFTATLKALVSLLNDCDEAVRLVRAMEEGLVRWAACLLAWGAAWRCSWALEGRTGKTAGALSPNETVQERFIFDAMLLLHSLLTHLHGQAQGAANGGVSQDLALDMALLQPSTDLFNALPGSSRGRTVERLSASYLRDRCPVIHQLMSRTTEAPHLPRSLTLSGLLIEILYLETADFLQDLEETDAAIIVSSALVAVNGSVAGAASPIAAKAGAAGSSGTPQLPRTPSTARVAGSSSSSKMASPAAPRGSTGKSRSESSMPIPVAELVVAAHAALLLHTLETNTTEGDKQKKQITSGADLRSALAALPRGDWWLCTRVLKAFLNLQGQTGIMLLDNIAPVMHALRSMQDSGVGVGGATAASSAPAPTGTATSPRGLQSGEGRDLGGATARSPQHRQPSADAPAQVSTTNKAVSKSACEALPDWIDFGAAGGVKASTSADSLFQPERARDQGAAAAHAGSEKEKERKQRAGRWEWNGHDYEWVTTTTTTTTTTAAAVDGAKKTESRSQVTVAAKSSPSKAWPEAEGRSITSPIVLDAPFPQTTTAPGAPSSPSPCSSSSSSSSSSSRVVEDLAPSNWKSAYRRKLASAQLLLSAGSREDSDSQESAYCSDKAARTSTQQSERSSGLAAPVTSLLPASATSAAAASLFAAKKKPLARSTSAPASSTTTHAPSSAGATGAGSSSKAVYRGEREETVSAATEGVAGGIAGGGGGWRAKRKFAAV